MWVNGTELNESQKQEVMKKFADQKAKPTMEEFINSFSFCIDKAGTLHKSHLWGLKREYNPDKPEYTSNWKKNR